jgi:hypothetical protein
LERRRETKGPRKTTSAKFFPGGFLFVDGPYFRDRKMGLQGNGVDDSRPLFSGRMNLVLDGFIKPKSHPHFSLHAYSKNDRIIVQIAGQF